MSDITELSSLDRLDCMIAGLKTMLELLYQFVSAEDCGATVPNAVYALQEYAEAMDKMLQRILKNSVEVKKNDSI